MSSTYTAPIVHADIKALAAELGRPAATLIALPLDAERGRDTDRVPA